MPGIISKTTRTASSHPFLLRGSRLLPPFPLGVTQSRTRLCEGRESFGSTLPARLGASRQRTASSRRAAAADRSRPSPRGGEEGEPGEGRGGVSGAPGAPTALPGRTEELLKAPLASVLLLLLLRREAHSVDFSCYFPLSALDPGDASHRLSSQLTPASNSTPG